MKYLLLGIGLLQAMAASSQAAKKPVQLVHADQILFDKSLVDAQRLVGHVHLIYEGTDFLCDSAYLYPNQNFDAFGNIRLQKGADYTATGDELYFHHATQRATLLNRVTLRDRQMTLTSQNLEYQVDRETARYTGGGKIVSNRNQNILTSKSGTYHSPSQTFFFRDEVVLRNPEYLVECDTLRYNEGTEIAYFLGPTHITNGETRIYCENGWYDSRNDFCRFNERARVIHRETILTGDSITFNGNSRTGEVFRNVMLQDTVNQILITGEYGRHEELVNRSLVTGRAMLTRAFEKDTLFVAADTLLGSSDSLDRKLIRAFHHVRLFKTDIQGVADSLIYSDADSTISFFEHPALWSADSQITGDTLRVRTWEGVIDRLYVRSNAFIASRALPADAPEDGPERFNQIRGRNATGFFVANDLRKVRVAGNGELIYFPVEEQGERKSVIGHNKGKCSEIEIGVENNRITRLNLMREPDSVFSPMELADPDQMELSGFIWRESERPLDRNDLFRR